MHATLWCDACDADLPGQRALADRALVARLRALPGFVAYVAFAGERGGIAALCVCEDARSLAAADDLIAQRGAADGVKRDTNAAARYTGAVVAQRGL